MILFPSMAGAFLFSLGAFLVLGALLLWWDKSRMRRWQSKVPNASPVLIRERAFDGGTACVFLLTSLSAWFLPHASPFKWYDHAAPWVLGGCVQGAWIAYRRKGPGAAWGGLLVLEGLFIALFASQLPLLTGTLPWAPYIWEWISRYRVAIGLVTAVLQVWLLSRYYLRGWLLLPAWVYSQAWRLMVPWLMMDYRTATKAVGHVGVSDRVFSLLLQLPLMILGALAIGVVLARPKCREPAPSAGWSAEFEVTQRSLKRCRPLEDPVRTVRALLGRWGLLIGAPILTWASTVIVLALLADAANRDGDAGSPRLEVAVGLIVPALQMTVIGFVVWLLTPSSETRPNAFFVRAFRRDDQTSRLRDLVSVALGPNGRMLGIRDPRKRFGAFTRLFALLEGALRYLGSNRCDLEGGDHNWLARVLATLHLRKVDVVLIDLREATAAVTVELKVVTQAMTPLRVIWLIDDTQPLEAWRQRIHQLTEGGVDADAPLNLLDVREATEGNSRAVLEMVERVLTEGSHPLHADEWQQAVIQAHQLARTHVQEGDWNTSWFETLAGGFWVVAALLAIVIPLLQALDLSVAGVVVMLSVLVVGLVLLVRTLISGTQALLRRRRMIRLGRELAPHRGW